MLSNDDEMAAPLDKELDIVSSSPEEAWRESEDNGRCLPAVLAEGFLRRCRGRCCRRGPELSSPSSDMYVIETSADYSM